VAADRVHRALVTPATGKARSRGRVPNPPARPDPSDRPRARCATASPTQHPGAVDIILFDVRALADDGTWGALRAAAEPPRHPIRELIAELLGDRSLSTVLRATYAEELMNRAADTNTRRDPTTFERLLRTVERLDAEYERARAEGREEGHAAGRREVRRDAELALLASLSPALEPSVVDRLRGIAGTDAFAAELAEAVTAGRG
jgi:hypothetical protein